MVSVDEEAHARQMFRLAIEAAENCTRPRWWLARYGGFTSAKWIIDRETGLEYSAHVKRISALIK